MPVIRYTNTIKSIWEQYLRVVFGSDITPKEYRYNPNEKLSRIRIYREYPRRVYNLPMIVISSSTGDASLRYLGNEVVKDVNNVYNECVKNNTLKYTPIDHSLVGVYGLDPLTGNKTVYIEDKDFTVNCIKRKINWDLGTSEPELYYVTYATFDSDANGTIISDEYKISYDVTDVVKFSASAPTEFYKKGDIYFNTTDCKLYTYGESSWSKIGEYPVLGNLYFDLSTEYLYEYTLSGMTRVYAYDSFPRLYLNYTGTIDKGFLVYNSNFVNGYIANRHKDSWKHTVYLDYAPKEILEVYSYDNEGRKLYYNKDEVFISSNTRELVWVIPEPKKYFVTYRTVKSILMNAGNFVQSFLNVQVKFDVLARSSQERERLTDLLVLFIRHIVKPYIVKYFVYSGESVSGETQEALDNQTIYKNSVTVPCVSHYSNYIDNTIYALIKNINIDIEAENQ